MTALETLFPKSIFSNFETLFSYDCDAEVDQPMGAALLVRREAFQDIGYLDERFKIYYNEVDWCLRIRQTGWKIYFVHDAEIIHHGGKTTAITNRHFEQFEEMYRNCLFYYEKHFGRSAVVLYKLMLVVGFAFRLLFWNIVALRKKSEDALYRLTYAKKSLRIGLRFWRMSV
jgi:GT2 family glycosyltransferase